ncbi:MAG: serine/threonine-protein kinase [Acidobacteriota bacterium]
MGDEALNRLEELFADALEKPVEARGSFLDQACAGDKALREELDELLELHEEAADYFDELSGSITGAAPLELESAAQSRIQIGAYRVIEPIGRGGMGTVFRAERVDGEFDQEVALKLLHLDMDTPELRARFLAERQLLAGLSHPNIARLLDGGVTDESRPFFAMELVEGKPITRYCDDNRVSTDEMLKLFLDVVDAVSYLHRNLVVHRDLKPSNIFVDGDGQVKLLDFGIAKLLADEEGATTVTRGGRQLMTPEYAAPEQRMGQPVTTATDVYALGVVLYELLTGQRPLDHRRGDNRSPTRDLPPTPSSVLRSRSIGKPPTSDDRAVEREAAPRHRITRDLDAICLMALRPDPEARYRSAEQLGRDIERHLDGLPVRARSGSVGYRAGLFVRRHRSGIVVTAALAALMVFGLVREISLRGVAEQARTEAELQAAKAVAVSQFLGDLLSSVDPKKAQGEQVAVVDVLEQASQRISGGGELGDQPEVEAAVRRIIGDTYISLGRYHDALEHLESAAHLFGWPESRDPEAMSAAAELGVLYQRLGLFDKSEDLLVAVLEARVESLGEEHLATLMSLNHLADLYFAMGRIDEVEPLDRRTLEIRRRVLGEDHPDTLRSLNGLAATLFNRGSYSEAALLFEEGLAVRRRTLGENHPDTLMLANNLSAAYTELGRYAEAEVQLREVVAGRTRVLGEVHDQTIMSVHNLGVTLAQLGRYEEAETQLLRAIAAREQQPGEKRSLFFSRSYLADVLRAQHRYDEAMALYLRTWKAQRQEYGDEDGETLKTAAGLAELWSMQGNLPAAEALLDEILEAQLRVRGEEHPDTLQSLTTMAHIRNEQGRYGEALALCTRAMEAGSRSLGAEHSAVLQAATEKVRALEGLGREGEARALAERVAETYSTTLGEEHPATMEARRRLLE